jgi:predicted outer membrane repeat protein
VTAASLTVTNATLQNNSASVHGGAIFNFSGTAWVSRCTLSNNSAKYGGGFESDGGTATITGDQLADNSAGSMGGAVFFQAGVSPASYEVDTSTFIGNSAVDNYPNVAGPYTNGGGNNPANP